MSPQHLKVYKLIQAGLIEWMFDLSGENTNLIADGVWGEHSRSVALMFQLAYGIPPTGEPSEAMIRLLFPRKPIRQSLLSYVFCSSPQSHAVSDPLSSAFLGAEVTVSMTNVPLDTLDSELDGAPKKE